MPDVGAGTREIRVRTRDGAFRVFYVVESATDVYVLHAFQKKSQKTAASDLEKGKARYRLIP
ncbi:type II toxin-antitoxin system RelE/ParE family toxin [Pseudoxanthomonas jiangsuensis]|uniref:type II toxin-antitoxin system RelE/ParE family toxin n=1 Tax=Pseudoxanthomonas jiangsuensis TaxID=619688 RepID=UPI001478A24E|nr:type II toxin-antitoxin system RelE/ParE family toxin [Pseudoxanthomonas jiangsuensis]